jgi:hypothetical protein
VVLFAGREVLIAASKAVQHWTDGQNFDRGVRITDNRNVEDGLNSCILSLLRPLDECRACISK